MEKTGSPITAEIQELLNSPNCAQALREQFDDMHPYDIFVLLEGLDSKQIAECVKALGSPVGIQVFEEFEDDQKKEIFDCFSKEWMADILEEMAPDERADFVKYLPEEKIEEVLPLVARAERIDIKKLIRYQEGTAGSILTTEYASLPPDITAKAAMEKIKLQAFDRETIYYIYVVDHDRKLMGFVSLRDLLTAVSTRRVEDIMNKNVISVNVDEDKEEVAKKFADYDFLAAPVVDEENRLLGIVTVDDVMDVVEEETTEDIYKYGAAGGYVDYLKSHPFLVARQRTLWLMILIFVGSITAFVLRTNSSQLQSVVALSFFIPLLLGTSGNAGTQASTVVVRGLATGDINLVDVFRVWRKEIGIGICVGVFMSLLALGMALIMGKDPRLGITVGSAMVVTVTVATSLGALLPMLFKRLNLDPALMSGPFITSIMDIVSLLIYFKIASFIF